MNVMYNIFISHSWSYSSQYFRIKELLESDSSFCFKDYSVPINDPIHNISNHEELKEAIRRQIRPASCVIILAGVYATYSKWINIEIELAKQMGKSIIAVEPFGSERTSTVVKENADKIVKWNTNSIVNAIKEYCKSQ